MGTRVQRPRTFFFRCSSTIHLYSSCKVFFFFSVRICFDVCNGCLEEKIKPPAEPARVDKLLLSVFHAVTVTLLSNGRYFTLVCALHSSINVELWIASDVHAFLRTFYSERGEKTGHYFLAKRVGTGCDGKNQKNALSLNTLCFESCGMHKEYTWF